MAEAAIVMHSSEITATTDIPASVYREFIKEIFIDPIRTAVVVDDEFPTLEDFLDNHESLSKKMGYKDKVREIISFCRNREPYPWLVDVHDGRTPALVAESNSAKRYDHTDLLILDYHLDGESGSDKAIDILRRLAGNDHFNLVVVYTQDRNVAGGGIDNTMSEIALALSAPSPSFELKKRRADHIGSKIDEWEFSESGILKLLLDSLDETAYLKVLAFNSKIWTDVQGIPELGVLASYLASIPKSIGVSAGDVFLYLMHERQRLIKNKMSELSYGVVVTGREGDVNWIRLNSLFVTVVSKEYAASEIPEKLLLALEAWKPDPHRLIMSKLRNELGQHGVAAEGNILRNKHLQAGWLEEILDSDQVKRHANVTQNVARHWESLGDKIRPNVLNFANRLASELVREGEFDLIFERFSLSEAKQQHDAVRMQMNSYVCSKPIEGHHLATGHIIRMDEGGGGCTLWLCLTPACDLVPGQKKSGWRGRLDQWLPFKAVRLFTAYPGVAVEKAVQGLHLFISENGEIVPYGFADPAQGNFNPTLGWEQFFAENQGRFSVDAADVRTFNITRIRHDVSLKTEIVSAKIVAQLRYEYALNLMNRLGAHLSRVGLDFVPPRAS